MPLIRFHWFCRKYSSTKIFFLYELFRKEIRMQRLSGLFAGGKVNSAIPLVDCRYTEYSDLFMNVFK